MGHTDVVPVNPAGWSRDPFGGELVDGEVWGRGAVDMLNLTASMAVAFRHLAAGGFRPRGDLVYFAVADEESGSAHGARWMADHEPDAIRVDYVLTENGGIALRVAGRHPSIGINVGEKGVAWRRLRVTGHAGPRLDAVPHRQRAGEGGGGRAAPRRLPPAAPLPRAVDGAGGRRSAVDDATTAPRCSTPTRSTTLLAAMPNRRRRRVPPRLHAHDLLVQRGSAATRA